MLLSWKRYLSRSSSSSKGPFIFMTRNYAPGPSVPKLNWQGHGQILKLGWARKRNRVNLDSTCWMKRQSVDPKLICLLPVRHITIAIKMLGMWPQMVPVAETILAVLGRHKVAMVFGSQSCHHWHWHGGMGIVTTLANLTYILCFIRWQFQKLETSPPPHKHPWSPFQFHYCFQVS